MKTIYSSGLKIYIKFHRDFFRTIYNKIVQGFTGKIFCLAMNIQLQLSGLKERCFYQPQTKSYLLNDRINGRVLAFANQKMGHSHYSRGIKFRAAWIGSEYLLHLIDFHPHDVVIDCGANIGDIKLYFSDTIKCPIEYYGFEPSPIEYSCLAKNVFPSRAFNHGLWFEDSNLDFYVSSNGGDSSFIEPPTFEKIIKISTLRLDSILREIPKIKLLKVEAEGAEPEVLLGAIGVLNKIEFITADLGYERGINKESTLQSVIDFLYKNNFSLVHATTEPRLIVLFKNNF